MMTHRRTSGMRLQIIRVEWPRQSAPITRSSWILKPLALVILAFCLPCRAESMPPGYNVSLCVILPPDCLTPGGSGILMTNCTLFSNCDLQGQVSQECLENVCGEFLLNVTASSATATQCPDQRSGLPCGLLGAGAGGDVDEMEACRIHANASVDTGVYILDCTHSGNLSSDTPDGSRPDVPCVWPVVVGCDMSHETCMNMASNDSLGYMATPASEQEDTDPRFIVAVVTGSLAVVLVIAIILAVYIYKRKRQTSTSSASLAELTTSVTRSRIPRIVDNMYMVSPSTGTGAEAEAGYAVIEGDSESRPVSSGTHQYASIEFLGAQAEAVESGERPAGSSNEFVEGLHAPGDNDIYDNTVPRIDDGPGADTHTQNGPTEQGPISQANTQPTTPLYSQVMKQRTSPDDGTGTSNSAQNHELPRQSSPETSSAQPPRVSFESETEDVNVLRTAQGGIEIPDNQYENIPARDEPVEALSPLPTNVPLVADEITGISHNQIVMPKIADTNTTGRTDTSNAVLYQNVPGVAGERPISLSSDAVSVSGFHTPSDNIIYDNAVPRIDGGLGAETHTQNGPTEQRTSPDDGTGTSNSAQNHELPSQPSPETYSAQPPRVSFESETEDVNVLRTAQGGIEIPDHQYENIPARDEPVEALSPLPPNVPLVADEITGISQSGCDAEDGEH